MSDKQTKPKVLPHLNKGMSIPEVPIPASQHEVMMPGQKPLPNPDNEQQLVVASSSNNRLSVQRQGLPLTEQYNKSTDNEPPPMLAATPSRKTTIRRVRDSASQKQVNRMNSGVDPVGLLTARLEAWRLALKSMVALFKKIAAVEKRTSKGFVEASKEIHVPFEKSNGQFLEVGTGGIQDVWVAFRDYAVQHSILHDESGGYIEKTVVPTFRAVKTDIKNMLTAIDKDKALKSDLIFQSRLKFQKLTNQLDKTIEACNRNPQQAGQNKDPFLVNLQIIHAIRELCDQENKLHDHILNLQKEVGLFEQKIQENCRFALRNLKEYRLEKKLDHEEFIGKIVETFNVIKPNNEWEEFVRRNQYSLILENSAYKTEDMIQYPNQDHKFVRALKIGLLTAKTSSFKNAAETTHILTPAGFLHGYKSPKSFEQNPLQPSYSIFIPSCEIEYNEDGSFRLRKNSKRPGASTNATFHPPHPLEGKEWANEFAKIGEQFKVVPVLDPSHYSSAPTTRHLPALPSNILPQQTMRIEGGETSGTRGECDEDPVLEDELDPVLENEPNTNEEDESVITSQQLPHPAATLSATNINESNNEDDESNGGIDTYESKLSPMGLNEEEDDDISFVYTGLGAIQPVQPVNLEVDSTEENAHDEIPIEEEDAETIENLKQQIQDDFYAPIFNQAHTNKSRDQTTAM